MNQRILSRAERIRRDAGVRCFPYCVIGFFRRNRTNPNISATKFKHPESTSFPSTGSWSVSLLLFFNSNFLSLGTCFDVPRPREGFVRRNRLIKIIMLANCDTLKSAYACFFSFYFLIFFALVSFPNATKLFNYS